MRWENALGSVGEVRTVASDEGWRGRLAPAVFREHQWPVLVVLAARVGAFGGSLAAGSGPGGGFRGLAEIPAEPVP